MARILQKRAKQDFQVRQNIAHQVYWLHKKCLDHWKNVKTYVFEGCCFRGEEGGGWRGGDGDDEGEGGSGHPNFMNPFEYGKSSLDKLFKRFGTKTQTKP